MTAKPTEPNGVDQLREDLAAAFRLAEKYDFHEGICNHFSVAVPGSRECYLINAYGYHWSEIRADNLLLIDGAGTILEGEGEVEESARVIHVAGHRANPRHQVILHTHMPYATSLTMRKDGRLKMAHQTAVRFYDRVIYEDEFGGIALDDDEGIRLAEKAKNFPFGDVTFLANHGVVVAGETIACAFDDLYYLERACRQQVLAESSGDELRLISNEMIAFTSRQYKQIYRHQAEEHFVALRRLLN